MIWEEILRHFPHQWLLLKAMKAGSPAIHVTKLILVTRESCVW
jgi:hypothetical protein